MESQIAHESLPKFELDVFSGDPLKWPEWKGMFESTCCKPSVSLDHRMRYLKLFTSGKAKATIDGFGYLGVHFDQAFASLQKRFGAPHIIVGAQIEKLSKHPQVKMHNSASIIEFSQVVNSFVSVLSAEKFFSDLQCSSNLSLVVSKLPINLRESWFGFIERLSVVNLITFRDWFQQKASVHERLLMSNTSNFTQLEKNDKLRKHQVLASNVVKTSNNNQSANVRKDQCPSCNQSHKIWKCSSFLSKSVKQRSAFVREKQLCFTCLQSGHMARDCSSKLKCRKSGCGKSHNSLLHNDISSSVVSGSKNENGVTSCTVSRARKGALQVIEIGLKSGSSNTKAWALCDTGSTHSWVSEYVKSCLGLVGSSETVCVRGVTGSLEGDTSCVNLELFSLEDESFIPLKFSALVRAGLSLGDEKLDLKNVKSCCPHLKVIKADVIDYSKISVILGQDVYSAICPIGYQTSDNHLPWAVKLPIGWVLSGPLQNCKSLKSSVCFTSSGASVDESVDLDLATQVSKWWALESYASFVSVDPRSKSDKKALETLEKTCVFTGKRYCVGLLWDPDAKPLSNNFPLAKCQLLSLERRLCKNSELQVGYVKSIEDDIANGYVRKVPFTEVKTTQSLPQWYLPHHPVVNPNKPSKIRRVCNAAARFAGNSLNEVLVPGPDLLSDLIGILIRFRLFKIGFSADIEAMFMQVEVPEHEQRFLRFLWREGPSSEIETFQYTRHIFGAKSSPTCANFVVQQTARDNVKSFPVASKAVFTSFYVDDFLQSVPCESDAVVLASQLVNMLTKGGFNLTKFVTNSLEVYKSLEKDVTFAEPFSEMEVTTILGIQWDLKNDTLYVCRGVSNPLPGNITQRKVLSVVSSVFDPLGFVSPFTIRGRLILKELWQLVGQAWDKHVPDKIKCLFENWNSELPLVSTFKIQRSILNESFVDCSHELHVFVDASQSAMCAVAYLRSVQCENVIVSFLVAKCRVAPIRASTIPKLELQAAVIGLRLSMSIQSFLPFSVQNCFFWSDSSTALQWISSSDKRLPVFVANRVAEIIDGSNVEQWNFVPGQINPADIGTRGIKMSELENTDWLRGPSFLKLDKSKWPEKPQFVDSVSNSSVCSEKFLPKLVLGELFRKVSSFPKLKRIVAFVLKVRPALHRSEKSSNPVLTVDELAKAEMCIWSQVQLESFPKEVLSLYSDNVVPSNSQLAPLVPFLINGLIRARGRLRKASCLSFEQKHPVILSSKHLVVKMFLNDVHISNAHEGVEYLRSIVQQLFWILRLRSELRRIRLKCVFCTKRAPMISAPMMADLPLERLGFGNAPFAFTGIDFFGPFEVKIARSSHKRWCCLFTCLTVRAVHIEVCHSLSTDSCLLAIQRFVARRGLPATFYSDNGTNFVGASNEIKSFVKTLSETDLIESYLTERSCQWKFNPPSSPHFGGAWERLVPSCKKAMFAILSSRRLTEETLSTTICLVEQVLNARPLTCASSDPNDFEALTPNHFLLGRASVSLPVGVVKPDDFNHRRVFRQSQSHLSWIWKRWMHEYVPQLQKRHKWFSDSNCNICVGSLVWIVDNGSPKGHYPLARVTKLNIGDDGVTRSALVKTSKGSFVRPLVKLVPLPLCGSCDQERAPGCSE